MKAQATLRAESKKSSLTPKNKFQTVKTIVANVQVREATKHAAAAAALRLEQVVSAEQSCDQMFKHFEAARLREARRLYRL